MIRSKYVIAVALGGLFMAHAQADDHRHDHERGHRGHGSEYGSSSFSFALIGDGPYGDAREAAFDEMLRDINRDREVEFVVHIGDLKSGGTECSDERLERRFDQLQQIRTALVYTPGDNEWTDCHRSNNGAYDPLERLDFIRALFFPNPTRTTGRRPLRVLSQSMLPGYTPFVENTLFIKNRVVFAQTHVVGSANNLRPWSGIDPNDSLEAPRADRLAEYTARNAANLSWLDQAFALARARHAAGVVVSLQADMNLELPAGDPGRLGFDAFIERLFTLTREFGRPVLLAHGDSHLFRVDTPRLRPSYHSPEPELVVPTLTRVESFGDSEVHWVKIDVDPRSPEVFSIAPRIVDANL